MADRASASITIGGTISSTLYDDLCGLIEAEALCIEWDGDPFVPEHHVNGTPLTLYAHQVACGRFDTLESWCMDKGLHFARFSDACPGSWGCSRTLFFGGGEPLTCPASEDGEILLTRATAEELGSFTAILLYFDHARSPVPPLIITPAADRTACEGANDY